MKNSVIAIGVILLTALASCKKDDVKTIAAVEKSVASGTWKISLFNDSGTDETYYFNGYSFTFNEDGTVTASNGSTTVSGTWSVTDSNSNDDSSDDVDFNLFFSSGNNFDELNDDWDIQTHSDNRIELIDVSGGNGGTDLLTFEKQ